MRNSTLSAALGLCLVLGSCGSVATTSIDEENMNPLTASRYGDELADGMADIIIAGTAMKKDIVHKDFIESEILRGKQIAKDARDKQAEGMMGALIGVGADASGYALYVDDTLFLSSDFFVTPGADVRVYLTTLVDPRDGSGSTFPDDTAVSLGSLQTTYGAQQYDVTSQKDPSKLRTLVIWDKKLERIDAFAQLSKPL